MFGTSGMESCNSRAWDHSYVAFKVLEMSYIGDIYASGKEEEWIMKDPKTKLPKMSAEDWSLEKKWELSPTTLYYSFANPGFNIHLAPKGVDWIGKHYVLTNHKKSRVYTNCSMLDPQVVEFRANLIK